MTSFMRISTKLSDSRWLPDGHFSCYFDVFLHISPEVLTIEYPFQVQIGLLRYNESVEDIHRVLRFKMAAGN